MLHSTLQLALQLILQVLGQGSDMYIQQFITQCMSFFFFKSTIYYTGLVGRPYAVYVWGSNNWIFWDYVMDFTISSLACPDIITRTRGPSGSPISDIYYHIIYTASSPTPWLKLQLISPSDKMPLALAKLPPEIILDNLLPLLSTADLLRLTVTSKVCPLFQKSKANLLNLSLT